jgi:putative redox protein
MDASTSADRMEQIRIATTLQAGPNRQIIATARGHKICMDIRKEWGGDNAGPTPPECMVIGLGGCVMNIARIIAQEKQIPLDNIKITVSGDIDPSRAFGLETKARAGFSQLSVQVELSPELSESVRQEFCRELTQRCPLCDTIGNPTPLQIRM